MNNVLTILSSLNRLFGLLPPSLALFSLRCALAVPFWNSGRTKWLPMSDWDPFPRLSDSVFYLFTEEFRLHIFGGAYAYPFPKLLAYASATGEIVLPILLVLGIGTRFAGAGILAMTAVIQLTVPDGWASFHLPWAAMALAIMTFGPGRLALDSFMSGFVERRRLATR